MDDSAESTRRHNEQAARIVDCGITLQFLAGSEEAKRYLDGHGIPVHVVERVLSNLGAPLRRRSGAIQDRRHL